MPIERTDRLELQKILQIGQIDVGNETLFWLSAAAEVVQLQFVRQSEQQSKS